MMALCTHGKADKMDAHTAFDPHSFGRSAAVDIFGAGVALAGVVSAAVANAQAMADADATARTVEEWHACVQTLAAELEAAIKKNGALAAALSRALELNRMQEAEIAALTADV
jgi:hypothetical protein